MGNEQIKRDYDLFQIPSEKVPHYDNPHQLAGTYKRCSLYEYVSITYSGSSMSSENTNIQQK
jgi:hypothetical protein